MKKFLCWLRFLLVPIKPSGAYRELAVHRRRWIAATFAAHARSGLSPDLARASVLHVCGHTAEAVAILDRVVATGPADHRESALHELAEIHGSEGRLAMAIDAVDRAVAEAQPGRRGVVLGSGGLLLLRYGVDSRGEAMALQAFEQLLEELPANALWLCAVGARYGDHLRAANRAEEAASLMERIRAKDPSLFTADSMYSSLLLPPTAA